MKKLWNIAGWTLGFALLISLLAFSSQCRNSVQLSKIEIEVDYHRDLHFVTTEEIEKIVRDEYPYLDSLFCKEININLLEERLDNHPSIRKAEVYSALDGILRIDVTQKQPVFRVQNSGRAYYIDEVGDSMALSPNYSARVPLVTGSISPETAKAVFGLYQQLQADEFYRDFFAGVHVEENGGWTLYPRPGQHKILLGQPEELKEKLKRLKIFYHSVVDSGNLDSIKALNLAFDKQVVCTKL